MIKPIIPLLAILIIALPLTVSADEESENATLVRLVHELDALQPLINDAEKQQSANVRIRFNYAALRSDLHKISTGIDQRLHQTAIEPRTVQPVSGDYVELVSLKQ